MKPRHFLAVLALPLLAATATAADPAPAADEEAAPAGAPAVLKLGEPDSVRTNLWLAEALMREAVREAARSLPPAPGLVVMVPADKEDATELLSTIVTQVLGTAGYELNLDQAPPGHEGKHWEFRYEVLELVLDYPQVSRRAGIWKDWIGREMHFTGLFTVLENPGGRILFSDRVDRGFADRVPANDLAGVDSPMYDFTTAEPRESGWKRRIEQIVVLGALAGLVAIYFANTE